MQCLEMVLAEVPLLCLDYFTLYTTNAVAIRVSDHKQTEMPEQFYWLAY